MSEDREAQLVEIITAFKHSETARAVVELLTLRREHYRDRLEASENAEVRGKSKECKDLIQLFS